MVLSSFQPTETKYVLRLLALIIFQSPVLQPLHSKVLLRKQASAMCLQVGSHDNPCGVKVVGPTLGLVALAVTGVVAWPVGAIAWLCDEKAGRRIMALPVYTVHPAVSSAIPCAVLLSPRISQPVDDSPIHLISQLPDACLTAPGASSYPGAGRARLAPPRHFSSLLFRRPSGLGTLVFDSSAFRPLSPAIFASLPARVAFERRRALAADQEDMAAASGISERGMAPAMRSGADGVYYFVIPVRPLAGQISMEHLERLSVYNSLYGALFVAAGLVAILLPLIFPLTLGVAIKTLGWVLLVGGVVTFLHFLFLCGAPGTVAQLFLGLIHIAIGFSLVTGTGLVQGPNALQFILAGWFLAQGVFKSALGVSLRSISSWPMVLLSGMIAIALGFVVFAQPPQPEEPSKDFVRLAGLLVGVDIFITGVSMLVIALLSSWGE
ncbi:unnamed protein product [Closterium sp. NIES-53]